MREPPPDKGKRERKGFYSPVSQVLKRTPALTDGLASSNQLQTDNCPKIMPTKNHHFGCTSTTTATITMAIGDRDMDNVRLSSLQPRV
jgi:hypothetical protein